MRIRTTPESVNAFATPTVVHFGVALLVSAIMSAPWPSLFSPSVVLAMCGLGGLVYVGVSVRRVRRQTRYKPVWEDWLWHATFPWGLYAALSVAALFLSTTTQLASFVIAGASLGLLLVGIHNAWDTVTHIVVADSSGDTTKAG
jgi:hypothetical protein